MLNLVFFGSLFVSLVGSNNVSSSVTTTPTTIKNNQSLENEKMQNFLPMFDFSPMLNQNSRTQNPFVSAPSNLYYNKGIYNPRNTPLVATDSLPYIIDSNPNFGHPIVEHQSESALKPTSRHFVIVGFIGLLLLFAVIQNTIEANKRKTALVEALSSRKKRDLSKIHGLDSLTPEEEDIFNDDARLRCLQWMVCLQNHKLLQDFGTSGKVLAKYLMKYLIETLNSSASSEWSSLIEDAAFSGFRGEDCNILYRNCT